MSIQYIRTPMTAAALTLLLTACGGGGDGGSERAVSSSPTAPGAYDTVYVNIDASSAAVAGSAAGAGAGQGSNGGEANAAGAGSGGASNNGNGVDSSSNSDASASTPAPTPAPTPTQPEPTPAQPGSATPEQPAPATPATPAEVSPISTQGIRGDVFLAMLEQKPCGHDGLQPATGPDGSKGSDGMVNFFAETSLGNYKIDPDYVIVGFRHGFGCNGKNYEPVKPGEHTFSISNSVFAKFYTPPRPFNMFRMEVPVSITADDVLLGNDMKISSVAMSHTPTITSQRFETQLTVDSPYRVKLNEVVPFGILKQWNNGEQSEQLMVLQGGNAQEARMCWNTNITHIKRLQCMIWSVPKDWKAGGKLNPVNVTLVEDRSVYEGETGMAYWD
ncbi:MAG: hypothetical protein Q4A16_11180 [Lautropia sp.]|nr:hypothetical protein [Lautropia sp.]